MFSYKINDELELAVPRLTDGEALYDLIDRNRDNLSYYLPWVDHVHDVQAETDAIRRGLVRFAEGKALDLHIWYHGRLAGNVSLNSIDAVYSEADIGYFLGKEFRGRGIMTLAIRAIIDIAFEEYGLHRIMLQCAVDNLPSNNVAKRLGMRFEGCHKGRLILRDGYHDSNEYAVLAEEWPDVQKKY